jgi:hypothetical protein
MRHTTHKPTGLRIRVPHSTPQTIVIHNDIARPKYGVECNVEGCSYVRAATLPGLGAAQTIARQHAKEAHS